MAKPDHLSMLIADLQRQRKDLERDLANDERSSHVTDIRKKLEQLSQRAEELARTQDKKSH